jgi:hypothetical protein
VGHVRSLAVIFPDFLGIFYAVLTNVFASAVFALVQVAVAHHRMSVELVQWLGFAALEARLLHHRTRHSSD